MDLSFILNELGEERDLYLGSVAPPVFQTSMFCFKNIEAMRHALTHEASVPFYTRGNNPTTTILQQKIAALERAEAALAFASGSAAIAAAIMANIQAGEHIVCVQKPYSWTNKLLNKLLTRFGIEATMIDGKQSINFKQAIKPNTKIIFLESPNSWTFEQQPIEEVVAIAKQNGILTIIDNSFASPLYQNPIEMGVDIVTHSASKYIGGHSDVVAGVLCGTNAMINKIFGGEFMTLGGVIAPFNAWLLLRGLRTLQVRIERSSQTTADVVDYLVKHPKVAHVFYPFAPNEPQLALSKQQLKGGGGLFTVALKTEDMAAVERFCNALKRFLLACSWGGYESLQFPACTLYASANYQTTDLHWSWVRFSVGLEEPAILIADFEQALSLL